MARSRDLFGPYELHPRDLPPHLQGRPRRAPAARRPRPDRRDPGRPHLPHPPLLPPAPRPPPLARSAARPRSRTASGATTAGSTSSTAASSPRVEVPAPPGAPEPEPDRPVEYRFDGPALPRGLPVAAHPLPRAPLHPDRRRAAPARPRVDRQLVRAGAGRPPPAAPPLPRRDPPRRLRPRHLPAGRRPHDLLQPLQVPLPRRHPRRRPRPRPHHPLLPRRLARRPPQLPARTRRSRCPTARSTSPSRSPAPPSSSSSAPAASGCPPAPTLDASVISDEGGRGEHGSFTGAFVGMAAFDTSGRAAPADFAWFAYRPGLMPDRRRVLALIAASAGAGRCRPPPGRRAGRGPRRPDDARREARPAHHPQRRPRRHRPAGRRRTRRRPPRRPRRQPLQPLGPRGGPRRAAHRRRGDPPRHPALLRPRRHPRLPHHLPDPARRGRRLRPRALGGDRPPTPPPRPPPPASTSPSRRCSTSPATRAGAASPKAPARTPTSPPASPRPRSAASRAPTSPASPPPPSTSSPTAPALAGRDYAAVDVSDRALAEIYLPPFRAAVDAGAARDHARLHRHRRRAAHRAPRAPHRPPPRGMGLRRRRHQRLRRDRRAHQARRRRRRRRGRRAGAQRRRRHRHDVARLPSAACPRPSTAASSTIDAIDAAVARVLALKHRLGLFDDPYRRCTGPDPETPARRAARRAAARDAAARSIVLLQNRDARPAAARRPRPPRAHRPARRRRRRDARPLGRRRPRRRGGRASSPACAPPCPKPGIDHVPGVPIEGGDARRHRRGRRARPSAADRVILCLGEAAWMSGEAASRARIDLPGRQAELAAAVLATGTPVVVLLFSGRPLAMPEVFAARRRRRRLLVPRQRGRPRRRRPADRRDRPLRRPAGHLAARRRPGPDRLLRPPRRPPREPGRQVHQQVPRPAEHPAVPLRPRPRLHRLHPDRPRRHRHRAGHRRHRRHQHRPARRHRDRLPLHPRPRRHASPARRSSSSASSRVALAPGESRPLRFELRRADFAFPDADLRPTVEPGAFEIHLGFSADPADLRSTSVTLALSRLRLDAPAPGRAKLSPAQGGAPMIADASTIDRSAFDRTFDVCVIGAGPAGITLARRLAADGAQVALMEAGGLEITEESQDVYRRHQHRPGVLRPRHRPPALLRRHLEPLGRLEPRPRRRRLPAPSPGSRSPAGRSRSSTSTPTAPRPTRSSTSPTPPRRPTCRCARRATTSTASSSASRPRPASPRSTRPRSRPPTRSASSSTPTSSTSASTTPSPPSPAPSSARYDPADPGFTVKARAYALCTGGIENARLLLNFTEPDPRGHRQPHGLGRPLLRRPPALPDRRGRPARPRPRARVLRPDRALHRGARLPELRPAPRAALDLAVRAAGAIAARRCRPRSSTSSSSGWCATPSSTAR